MAVVKFTNSKSSLKQIVDYVTQDSKTKEQYISGKDCMPETALLEMELVKSMYGKKNGRQYIHIVQSFDPKDELSYEKANAIGLQLAERFTGFQAVVATHEDRDHVHNHIVLNSVNFETGLKFQQSKKEMQDVKNYSDKLCLENGLSIIEKPNKNTDIGRNEYQAAIKGTSWKINLMFAIDSSLQTSENKEVFITTMNQLGYEVNWSDTRKNITYTTPDGKKCRDNKLHDEKYLKEQMENEFKRIEEKSATIAESQKRDLECAKQPSKSTNTTDFNGQLANYDETFSGTKASSGDYDDDDENNNTKQTGHTTNDNVSNKQVDRLDEPTNRPQQQRDKKGDKQSIQKFLAEFKAAKSSYGLKDERSDTNNLHSNNWDSNSESSFEIGRKKKHNELER